MMFCSVFVHPDSCKDLPVSRLKHGMHAGFAGSRQATRLRRRYLQAVLRQEAAYFDVHVRSGELLQGLNEDTSAIQLGIGEKVHIHSMQLN